MEIKGKNILVMGLGVSGTSTIKALDKLGAKIYLSESKSLDVIKSELETLIDINIKNIYPDNELPDIESIDFAVKNPGIPFDNKIVTTLENRGIEVLTDLELAYRLGLSENLIVITGTNGKTTTTSIVGEMFKNAGKDTHIVGNIGTGILWELVNGKKEDLTVVEASSFQLYSCKKLKASVASILNLSPDHLNWHKTYENYIEAKKNVLLNQDINDFAVLNYDDLNVRKMGEGLRANTLYFSRLEELERGIFLRDSCIIYREMDKEIEIIKIKDLKILGSHNVENAMAAIAIGISMGLEIDLIKETLSNFTAVEHRIEYVEEINGVKYYNDSKGTNVDASIKAIEAVEKDIILIAGGSDKNSDYTEFVKAFKSRVNVLILLGETKYSIEKAARNNGFDNIVLVEDMENAVKTAYLNAKTGDKVLLSPACASWDMYKSFEERGRDFKVNVLNLKGE